MDALMRFPGIRSMKSITRFLTGTCCGLALLVLSGWQLQIDFLKNPLPGSGGMNPTTALCLVLLSVAILLLLSKRKLFNNTGGLLALLCFLIAMYRLGEGLFSYTSYADQTLFLDALQREGSGSMLRMSPNGAVTFVLLCIALFLLKKGSVWTGQIMTTLAMIIAWFTLLGYINRVPEFYGLLSYLPMSLHTALCFFLLCIALFCFHPDKGIIREINSPLLGGRIARIFLPLLFIVPTLLGYLRLELHWNNKVSTEFGVSLLTVSIMLFFIMVLIVNIILLNRQDAVRRKNEEDQQHANLGLKERNEEIASLHEEMVAANEELTMMNEQLHAASEKIKEQAAIIVQQKDEHLNRALDSTNVIIWSMDLTGKGQHYMSRSAENISGIPVDDFLNQRDTWNRFVVAEDLEIRDAALLRLKEEGQTQEVLRVRDRDGGIRWISFQLKIVNDEHGQPLRQEGMAVDITSLKNSENELKKERSLLRSLVDNIPDYISVKDQSLNYIMNNKAGLSLLNESDEAARLMKASNGSGNTAATFLQDDLRVLASGEVILNKEEVIQTLKGPRIVLTTKVPLRDGEGVISGIVGISRDVTENRKSEQLLNQYRENLDIIFQSTLEEILLLDKEGRVVLFNKALEKFITASTGKPPVIGNYLWDTTLPERSEMARHLFNQALSGHPITTDAHVRSGGSLIVHELRYQPVFIDREVKYVMLISLDITERRNQENNIRHSEGNLRAIFNTTTDSFILLDMEFRIQAFNESFRKNSMLPEELKEGTKLADLVPVERQVLFNDYLIRARQGETVDYEMSSKRDGKVSWHQVTISPVKDNYADVIGICITSRDLTLRKQAEQERSNLIRKLTEQNNDLLQFSFITSHQLRGPVATLLGLLNLVHHEQLPEDLARLLSFMNSSVHQLDAVIGDLSLILTLRGDVPPAREWVNMNDLITSIQSEQQTALKESQASLFILPSEVTSFFVIKSYLHSILHQLISNSIKFRSKERPLVIEISTFREENSIGFTVKDNGMGIDLTRFNDKIFKLYQRFHLDIEGKGLGLHVVYTQVQQLNGNIHVESAPDRGSSFTVRFMND